MIKLLIPLLILCSFASFAQNQQMGSQEGNTQINGTASVVNVPQGTDDDVATWGPGNILRRISGIPRQTVTDLEWIYRENVEWITTENNPRIDEASTNAPCTGNLNVRAITAVNSDYIEFTYPGGTSPEFNRFNMFQFKIRSNGQLSAGQRIRLRWLNNGNQVGVQTFVAESSYGFNSMNTDSCQIINIPMSAFGNIGGATTIRFNTSIISAGSISYSIDDVCMIKQTITDPFDNGDLTWQATLINGSALSQNNFVNGNETVFQFDSLLQMIFNVTDYVAITARRDQGAGSTGREYLLKFQVNDAFPSLMAVTNATGSNGQFSPSIFSYTKPNDANGVFSFRIATDSSNDRADYTAMMNIAIEQSNDPTDPLNQIFHKIYKRRLFQITGVTPDELTEVYFVVHPNGQIGFDQYPDSMYTGTSIGSLQMDAAGKIFLGAAGGGAPSTQSLQQTTDIGNVTTANIQAAGFFANTSTTGFRINLNENGTVKSTGWVSAITQDNTNGSLSLQVNNASVSAGGSPTYSSGIVIKPNGAIGAGGTATGTSSFGGAGGTANNTNSFAAGASTASGTNSFAAGLGNTASGPNSSVFGTANTASGSGSFASGNTITNTASGSGSFALGVGNQATGQWSVAFGNQNVVSGQSAFALGRQNISVAGESSVALGISNVTLSTGAGAVAIGGVDTTSADFSAAIGERNKTTAKGSVAIGSLAKTSSMGEIALSGGAPADNSAVPGLIGQAQTSIIHFYRYDPVTTGLKQLDAGSFENRAANGDVTGTIPGLTYYSLDGGAIYYVQGRLVGITSTNDVCVWTIDTWVRNNAGTITFGNSAFTAVQKDAAFTNMDAVSLDASATASGNTKKLIITYHNTSTYPVAKYMCVLTVNKLRWLNP